MPNDNYTVEIYPLAEDDLDSIYKYYFKESCEKSIAIKIVDKLKEAILRLSYMPKSHPFAREKRLKKDGFRKLICGDYIILFLVDDNKMIVSVVRIFHGKMNYQKYV